MAEHKLHIGAILVVHWLDFGLILVQLWLDIALHWLDSGWTLVQNWLDFKLSNTGKMIVEFFSAEIEFSVWRKRSLGY